MSVRNTHYGAAEIARAMQSCHSVFFIGIGGISMAALAELSLSRGLRTGGSDRTQSALTARLQTLGVEVFAGHDAAQIRGYDAVVYTVAISEDNPEYCAAQAMGKPLFSRADYLGYLMTDFSERIGISGMHGKSTCTAMCTSILLAATDPTVMCGAQLPALENSSCRVGTARTHFLFEACEYMDSFLDFNPTLAVILNVDMDHVDYFHSMEQIRASFLGFANRTGEGGRLLYNADDAETCRTVAAFTGECHSFGLQAGAEFRAEHVLVEGGTVSFDLYRNETRLTSVSLRAVGRHNVYNALAAAGAAILCGISPEAVALGLSQYRGLHRRMEYRGTLASGAVVYDDYAHHPDEIRATLAGAREMGFARVLCAYQPHTFSRTAGLLDAFSKSFADADRVYFADVYAAREENIYGVTSQTLADRVGAAALYCGDFDSVVKTISAEAQNGDLVLVMGAGDIYKVFDLLGV